MIAWAWMQNALLKQRIASLERKLIRQAEQITRLERSREDMRAELRARAAVSKTTQHGEQSEAAGSR
jgi:hypothetical protein